MSERPDIDRLADTLTAALEAQFPEDHDWRAALDELVALARVETAADDILAHRAGAAEARVAELAETNRCVGEWLEESQTRVAKLQAALRKIEQQQPKTIAWLRSNGIVFDGPLGTDPDNWEHVAFSIYSDLCETDAIARAALSEVGA